MRLLDLTATAHPAGNRIDLSWQNPDPANFPQVRVVRRSGSYPQGPSDGTAVAAGTDGATVTDLGLHGERVYYYALFPFKAAVPGDPPDPGNLISATPVEPYRLRRARCTSCSRPSTGAMTPSTSGCAASSTCPAGSSTGSTARPRRRSTGPTRN